MDSFLQEAKAYARELGQRNLRIIKKNGNNSKILQECLLRYINGDYGEQPKEDIEINERAIASGYGDVMGEYNIDGYRIDRRMVREE